MSGLLFGVGALAVIVGAVMIGFGIPINEFSFGNTLIVAGTTSVVGGLTVFGLGAAVAQLQRIAEALASRTPIRSSRPLDIFDSVAGPRGTGAMGRGPFPPKPKSDAAIRESHSLDGHVDVPVPADMPIEDRPAQSAAPALRNPYDPPVTVEDEVSLSPQHPMSAPAGDLAEPAQPAEVAPQFAADSGMAETRQETRNEPTLDAGWRSPAPAPVQTRHTTYFDAMWPAEAKQTKSPVDSEAKSEPMLDLLPPDTDTAAPAENVEPEAPESPLESEPRTVAILKSGVVDGMGYTLYVDGSIEAELPQGTLHFASINELRSHLEKNS